MDTVLHAQTGDSSQRLPQLTQHPEDGRLASTYRGVKFSHKHKAVLFNKYYSTTCNFYTEESVHASSNLNFFQLAAHGGVKNTENCFRALQTSDVTWMLEYR